MNSHPSSSGKTYSIYAASMLSPLGRILIVEDNHAVRLLFSEYLLTCGYQVMAVGDGLNLLSYLQEFQPDLLILDLGLPDIDGFTLLQQLGKEEQWQTLPVVVVTGYSFRADYQRASNLGARAYLVKPIRLNQLAQTIKQLLNPRNQSSSDQSSD